jgi:hypothetical protein
LPRVFTPVTLQSDQPDVRIGIKLTPDDLIATANQEWEVRIDKDLRVPALVSLIKAAHLTVFRMCGYIYALHTAGLLIGNNILGEFYRKNKDQPREVILRNAETFFREWVTMVRPMIWSARSEFEGTVSDRKLLVCVGTSGRMWGMIVLIKTAHEVHAVLLPAFTDVDSAATYLEFLRNDNENIHIGSAEYDGDNRCWLVGTERAPLRWPKPGEDAT